MFRNEFHNRGDFILIVDTQDEALVWSGNLNKRDICRRREGFPALTSRRKNKCEGGYPNNNRPHKQLMTTELFLNVDPLIPGARIGDGLDDAHIAKAVFET